MEIKPTITFDDFSKLDIRTGQITKAERIPKSKKLLKLEVYFGEAGSRTILAGIAESYQDVIALTGIQVMAVLNLEPREMFGIMSHGMILAGKSSNGVISLAYCPGEDGTVIG